MKFIKIKDVRPAYKERVFIIKNDDINTIQTATYDKKETDERGTSYYFYDGRDGSIQPTHWMPIQSLTIDK
ncbi:MAG: hypothetical protein SLAVMIC_00689 [uncultured marine phage]|uniref:DUF551 domain-containing protein n=1 Tax=uncultured marine phage TaxID=707152 RepID=A0A8D9FRR4_9VIRU|nr:MAG: hypothetical protein SLAVMIC_00689 [uncultured marine phage]